MGARGAAGRAGFTVYRVRRGPVNPDVIRLGSAWCQIQLRNLQAFEWVAAKNIFNFNSLWYERNGQSDALYKNAILYLALIFLRGGGVGVGNTVLHPLVSSIRRI